MQKLKFFDGAFLYVPRELPALLALLREHRGVVLSGPYGCGKTVLGRLAAETLMTHFDGRVSYHSILDGRRPADIVASVATRDSEAETLVVIDDADRIESRLRRSFRGVVDAHPNATILLIGPTEPMHEPISGFQGLHVGAFSEEESKRFAKALSDHYEQELTSEEIEAVVAVTMGIPRLIARALQLADDYPASDLPGLLRDFKRPGLLDVNGRALRPVDVEQSLLITDVRTVNERLLQYVRARPDLLRSVTSRQFERIVAELLEEQGFEVEMTPPSKDGGFDIFAAQKNAVGSLLFLVECKRHAARRPVGVEVVRQLHGVVGHYRATAGVIATTSYFTKGAVDFQRTIEHQMSLRDYVELQEWLRAR